MKTLIDFFVDRYKATFTFLTFILVWGFTSIIQIPASAEAGICIIEVNPQTSIKVKNVNVAL